MDNFTFDRIGEFFSRMDSAESTYFLLCALISFLFGFFIAYLLRTARVSRLNSELRDSEKRYQDLEVELHTAKGKLREATEAWELVEREKVDLRDRAQRLEVDKRQLTNEALRLNSEIESLNHGNRAYAGDINALHNRIQELESQAAETETETPPAAEPTNPILAAEGPEIVTAQAGAVIQTEERLAAFEERLAQLERENQRLENRLEELDAALPPTDGAEREAAETTPLVGLIDSEEPRVAVNPDKNVMGRRIVTEDRRSDDLTQIEHIGTFVQNKLNQIGVFTYEDIAGWDPARIAQVTSLIDYLPGRIAKDNWVGQAAALAAAPEDSDTQSRGFAATAAVDLADLQIIEGIGPKIEQVLKESGVFNLNMLAQRDPEELRSMLTQAGDKYRMHNPDSWPKQAQLAVAGNLEELEAYQEVLKGGRE